MKKQRSGSILLRQKEERLNSDAFFMAQREEADIYATERDNLLDQAQIAFDCNDLPAAKELSDKAKVQHALYQEANKVAADVIFTTNNARVADHEIDFHGLYVEETIERLLERIEKDRERNSTNLTIIYGQGERNNDAETEREVILAVTQLLKEKKMAFKLYDLSEQVKKCRVTYNEAVGSSNATNSDGYHDTNLAPEDVMPSVADKTTHGCCLLS